MGLFDQQTTPYGAPMGGYQYNGYQGQAMPKINNNLSPDEIKELQQQRTQFSLGLTQRESLQAACNHRTADGMSDSLVMDQDTGVVRCTICGYEFKPLEPDTSYEVIKESADNIVDILQTIKLLYTDLPQEAAREYFQIIPLIEKIPQLFEFAAKNFSKHEFNAWSYNNHNMSGIAMLNNLNSLFGGSMGGFVPQPQPMQPQYNPYAPNPAAPVGYPQQQPMGNPFGYPGASAAPVAPQGYAPTTQGFAYQPGQAAPVAPTAPTVEETKQETVTKTVNV